MEQWLLVLGMIGGFYLLGVVPTRWLKIERIHLQLGINRRIIQISDLHVDMLRIGPEKLQAAVRDEQPDIIVLTGDFTFKQRYLPRVAKYLHLLMEIGVPIYAVLGNHDHKLRDLSALIALFRQYNITLLQNESIVIDGFRLVGIDDYGSGMSNPDKAFEKDDGSKPIVIITHNPNVVTKLRKPFSYLMAGHFHGKQINLPFLLAIKRKGELPSKGIYKGLHRLPFGIIYISKGIGQVGVNLRFLVRSEITVHDL
jgi:predicted MPP superfamily phosphohydrolase